MLYSISESERTSLVSQIVLKIVDCKNWLRKKRNLIEVDWSCECIYVIIVTCSTYNEDVCWLIA